jgi:hypothetical protein
MSQPSERNATLWHRLVDSYGQFAAAQGDFFANEVDRIGLVRSGLQATEMRQTAAALYLLRSMADSERIQLLDDLVRLSLHPGLAKRAREIIASMPRDQVLANVEHAAEPHLREGGGDEFRRILELFRELNPGLALKLARRAATHPDPDVKEAGEDFLAMLTANGNAVPTSTLATASS